LCLIRQRVTAIRRACPRASIAAIPEPASIRAGGVSGRRIASTIAAAEPAIAAAEPAIAAAIPAIATVITTTAARDTPLVVRADDPTTFNDRWVAASTPARRTAAMISAATANRITAIAAAKPAIAAITAIRKTQIAGVS
jgi:hypothetical protein